LAAIVEQSRGIRKIWSNFQSSRVLITSNNYRIFDCLETPKTAGSVAAETGTDKRATEILLDALVGLGLLRKQKNRYRNTKTASRFLVSDSPYYQGEIIRHVDGLWDRWSDLDTIVKTGKPSLRARNHEAFILGMHNIAVTKAKEVISGVGLRGVKRVLDLGCGPGTYSMEMAGNGIEVTLFDLPATIKIARGVVSRSGAKTENIRFMDGDFLTDDIGSGYDLILISQIVHMFSEKVNMMLLKKCRRALNENGRVVVHDFLINEARTMPPWSSLFAINMLVSTEGGRTYSPGDLKGWFLKSGFGNVRKKTVVDGVLVSARKKR
jgi:2-polyprenyl-3-methyl-5-hydroxy-6-metoxy-1,4-benzoquinol methylase